MRERLRDNIFDGRIRRRLATKRWREVVPVLGCIVVFCVTYALILPAITMTRKDPVCGIEEHVHSDACYDEEGDLICGLEESEGHTHDESCYETRLTCGLEEHTHTDACYPVDEDSTDDAANDGAEADNPASDSDNEAEAEAEGEAEGETQDEAADEPAEDIATPAVTLEEKTDNV